MGTFGVKTGLAQVSVAFPSRCWRSGGDGKREGCGEGRWMDESTRGFFGREARSKLTSSLFLFVLPPSIISYLASTR